jgi:hypothetical protein
MQGGGESAQVLMIERAPRGDAALHAEVRQSMQIMPISRNRMPAHAALMREMR